MKVRIALCLSVAALLVAAMGGRATAAQPNQDSLAAMGLGGMTVMSDSDALAVRGMGYSSKKKSSATAWGKSYAQVASHGAQSRSENGYKSEGKNYASGENLSYAGLLIVSGHVGGGGGYGGGGGGGPAANNYNGGGGGHPGGGGGVKVKAVVVFAGGSSKAKAH